MLPSCEDMVADASLQWASNCSLTYPTSSYIYVSYLPTQLEQPVLQISLSFATSGNHINTYTL